MIKQNNILRFNNLSQFPQLLHGFSTTAFGDMNYAHDGHAKAIQRFCNALHISSNQLVRMNQVHEGTVHLAAAKDGGQVIAKTDGLIDQQKDIFLGVITADCLPLLLYDPKANIVAAAHAGWRGLYAEIIKEVISHMKEKGSNPTDILVGIGPSIRSCCYNVDEAFVNRFGEKFDDVEKFIERRDGNIYFNLQQVAKEQLVSVGVLERHIEDADYCTFDHSDVYSCRREGKDFGEMMGIIGLR